MKNIKSKILPALLSLLLIGCSADESSDTYDTTSENKPAGAVTATPDKGNSSDKNNDYSTSGVLPVLNITSKDNPNSLDFVTEPVNEYVSSSIASWTPGYKIPPAPYYEACTITLTDADGKTLIGGVDADVKVRGNWTTSYDKKPLRIKFAEKQNLLGLNDGAEMKNWVLLAEYKDASMLRNITAFDIAEGLLEDEGLYVSDAQFVEVVINEEYWGLYVLAEYQQINSDRIAITEAEVDYQGTDIGYFLEYDGYYKEEPELQSFFVDYADNAPLLPFDGDNNPSETIRPLNEGRWDKKTDTGITIKSDIYSQEQHDFIESYINNVYRIMYYAAYEDKAYIFNEDYSAISESTDITPQQAVEAVVNVESLADIYILNEIACDADIYWSSFFMDVDFGAGGDKKLRFEAPWDFDSAFGNKNRCVKGTGFYAANIVWDVNDQYEAINPWLAVLMHEEWFKEIIREEWSEAYNSGVFSTAYNTIILSTSQYSTAFENNESRWHSITQNTAESEWSNYVRECDTHREMSQHFENWLRTRIDFLNEYWHN